VPAPAPPPPATTPARPPRPPSQTPAARRYRERYASDQQIATKESERVLAHYHSNKDAICRRRILASANAGHRVPRPSTLARYGIQFSAERGCYV
jgi:hypothetical protein